MASAGMDSFEATLLGLTVAGTLAGTPWFVYRAKKRAAAASAAAGVLAAKRTATARATIESMTRTGLTVNDEPQVELTMRLSDGASGSLQVKRLVDPLQASRFQPGSSFPVRFDPEDPSNVEVDFDGTGGGAEAAAPVAARGAPFEWPLWIYGQRDAEAWLLAPRDPAAAPVVVMETTDPHATGRAPLDEALIETSASAVAEALWMTTDAPAAAMAIVATETRKLVKPTGPLKAFDPYAPFLSERDPRSAVLWGAAKEDLGSEGIEWRARVPGDGAERSFAGPLQESTEMLVSWLVSRGLAKRTAPPSWWTPASTEALGVRATVLHDLRIQILADRRNGALSEIDAALHVGFVDLALDLAEQRPCELHTILAATAAHYARRAGQLTEALRARALRSIESAQDRASAVRRLSPHWLASLAGEERGRARREEMATGATGAYAAWLAKLAEPEKD